MYVPTSGVPGAGLPSTLTTWCPPSPPGPSGLGCYVVDVAEPVVGTTGATVECPAAQPVVLNCDCACSTSTGAPMPLAGCTTTVGTPGKCITSCVGSGKRALVRALCGPRTTTHSIGGSGGYP